MSSVSHSPCRYQEVTWTPGVQTLSLCDCATRGSSGHFQEVDVLLRKGKKLLFSLWEGRCVRQWIIPHLGVQTALRGAEEQLWTDFSALFRTGPEGEGQAFCRGLGFFLRPQPAFAGWGAGRPGPEDLLRAEVCLLGLPEPPATRR